MFSSEAFAGFGRVRIPVLKKHKPAFLEHIANGIENLLTVVDYVGGLKTHSDLATECETILARKNF